MDMGDEAQSKVVQEARKLMQDDDEDMGGKVQAENEDAGQGIRMGKLGARKKKRGGATRAAANDEAK